MRLLGVFFKIVLILPHFPFDVLGRLVFVLFISLAINVIICDIFLLFSLCFASFQLDFHSFQQENMIHLPLHIFRLIFKPTVYIKIVDLISQHSTIHSISCFLQNWISGWDYSSWVSGSHSHFCFIFFFMRFCDYTHRYSPFLCFSLRRLLIRLQPI